MILTKNGLIHCNELVIPRLLFRKLFNFPLIQQMFQSLFGYDLLFKESWGADWINSGKMFNAICSVLSTPTPLKRFLKLLYRADTPHIKKGDYVVFWTFQQVEL